MKLKIGNRKKLAEKLLSFEKINKYQCILSQATQEKKSEIQMTNY